MPSAIFSLPISAEGWGSLWTQLPSTRLHLTPTVGKSQVGPIPGLTHNLQLIGSRICVCLCRLCVHVYCMYFL